MKSSNGLSPSARTGRFHLPIVLALFSITLPASADEPAFDTWTSLDPPGGSIHQVATAPSDPRVRYAVGDTVSQVYRWHDADETWQRRGLLPLVRSATLAVDPADPSIVWAGGIHMFSSRPWVGRSVDGGSTWDEIAFDSGEPTDFVESLSLAPGRTLLAAPYSGIWLRQGSGWTRVLEGSFGVGLGADPDDLDRVFASVGGALWRSEDGGLTWASVLGPDSDVYGVFVAGGGSRVVYASFVELTLPHAEGVFRSLDDGSTWERIQGNAPSGLSPDDPSTLWAAEWDHVERSTDGGRSWSTVPLDLGIGHPRLLDVAFGETGEVSIFGRHGIWTSFDGGTTWDDANHGLHENTVEAVAVDPVDPAGLWAITAEAGLFHSPDGGGTWQRLAALEPGALRFPPRLQVVPGEPGEPRTVLLTGQEDDGGWIQSFDGGVTFETVFPAEGPQGSLVDARSDFSVHPNDPRRLVAAGGAFDRGAPVGGRLWSTDDGGRTWTQIANFYTPMSIQHVRHDPFDPEILYLAGDNLGRWREGVFTSVLGTFDSNAIATHFVQAVAVDPAVPGRLWAIAGPGRTGRTIDPVGLLRSDDRGTTWVVVSDAFLGRFVSDLEIVPGHPNRLLAVVDETVWSSDDAGATWSVLAPRATRARDLVIDPRFPTTLLSDAQVTFDPDDAFDDQPTARGVQRYVLTDGAGCDAATILCLGDGFHAEVTWRDFDDATGIGRSVPLASDTGAFWFFDSANLELVVKVLDGRAINGAYWVFYGSLSNVEYDLRVTASDGRVAAYRNPLGTFASTGDTEAFPEP